jgi:hypothetical protein
MRSRRGYKDYVIEARSCELRDGRILGGASIEEHDAGIACGTETATRR